MGDTHEGAGHTWVLPKGYALCGKGHCGEPEATGAAKDVAEWMCKQPSTCLSEGGEHDCACYLVLVHPRSKRVDILAKAGAKWPDQPLLPGWYTTCLCLYEDSNGPDPPPWKPGDELTAPAGYVFSDACGDCAPPLYDAAKRTWSCPNLDFTKTPGCFLVEVPRDGKQVHVLAGPGMPHHDIHESHLHRNWDAFCVCLK